jgi:photosystem II stability/assembly factor-like uncharacterized protein
MKRQISAIVAVVLISAGLLLVLLRAMAAPAATTPVVSEVEPLSVTNDSASTIVITGTDFAVVLSGTDIITLPTVYLDATSLGDAGWVSSATLTTTVPMGFPAGVYTVTVTNPDGQSGSLADGLTVQNPTPAVQSVTPVSSTYGQTTVLTITGTGFVATPAVSLGGVSCSVQYVSSTTLTMTVPGGLGPGTHTLIVRNPGPGSPQHVVPGAFTLYSPVPTVTSCEPASAANDLDTQVVITGTDFAPTPTAALDGTPLEQVSWVSPTRLTAVVPWGMDEGVYTLTVTNPDPGAASATLSDAFTVTQGIGVWNSGELYGGTINEIAINPITPTTLYARSDRVGLFRSYDGGDNWSFQFAGTLVGSLAVDPVSPTHVYMTGYPHGAWLGLFRSDDEGETWIPLTTTFPTTYTTGYECWGGFDIHPHPTIPGTVYVHSCDNSEEGGGGSGLIVSTNWGQDWEPAINGLTDTQVMALAFHPTDPDIMVLGTAGGHIFHSLDGGDSWTCDSRPLEYVASLAVDPFGEHSVWVSSHDVFGAPCALLKSAGADLTTWTAMEPSLDWNCFNEIEFSPTTSGTVYVNFGQPYKTIDGGDTWTPFIWVPFEAYSPSVLDIALHPTVSNTVYFADARLGVQKTTDGGTNWGVANRGLTALFPQQMQVPAQQPDIIYARMNQGDIYKGTQGGQVWQQLPISNTSFILIDPITPTQIYATLSRDCTPYVYTSHDSGLTWEPSAPMVRPAEYADHCSFGEAMVAVPDQPGVLVVGVDHHHAIQSENHGSIYRSADYGEHWTRVYPTGDEIRPVSVLAYDALAPTILYAGTWGSGMLRSTDGGQSWEPITQSVTLLTFLDVIAVQQDPPYRVYAIGAHTTSGLYYSEDHGLSWHQATRPPDPSNVLDMVATKGEPSILYSGSGQGLFRSVDGAQSWQRAAGSLGQVPVYALATATTVDRVILYAGTTGGQVQTDAAQTMDRAGVGATLVSAGVYRYTTRLPTERVYLPLVLSAHEQLSLRETEQGLGSRTVSKASSAHPSSGPRDDARIQPTLRTVLASGVLALAVSAVVAVVLHRPACADDAHRQPVEGVRMAG